MTHGPRVRPPTLYRGLDRIGIFTEMAFEDGHGVRLKASDFFRSETQGFIRGQLVPLLGADIGAVQRALAHRDVVLRTGVIDGMIHTVAARVAATELAAVGRIQLQLMPKQTRTRRVWPIQLTGAQIRAWRLEQAQDRQKGRKSR